MSARSAEANSRTLSRRNAARLWIGALCPAKQIQQCSRNCGAFCERMAFPLKSAELKRPLVQRWKLILPFHWSRTFFPLRDRTVRVALIISATEESWRQVASPACFLAPATSPRPIRQMNGFHSPNSRLRDTCLLSSCNLFPSNEPLHFFSPERMDDHG